MIEKEKIVPQAISNTMPYEDIEEKLQQTKNEIIYIEKNDTPIKEQMSKYEFRYKEITYYKSEIDKYYKNKKYLVK